MKIKIIIIILILNYFTAFYHPAFALQNMTLLDAIEYAFINNNELKSFGYSVSAKKRDIWIEKSSLMPKLRLEESFASTNNPGEALTYKLDQARITSTDLEITNLNHPKPVNNWLTSIVLEQPLLDKKATINIGIARNEYSSKTYEYLRKREKIATDVALAYFDVDRDTKIVAAVQKNLEESQENLNTVQEKYNKKKVTYSAVLRASSAVSSAKQELISATRDFNVSKRGLGLVLGEAASIDIVKKGLPAFEIKNINYYNANSMIRDDLKAEELKYEKTKKDLKLAEADYFPEIGIASSYRLYDHNAPFSVEGHNYYAGGFLNWNVFDGLKRMNKKEKAQDKVNEAFENLEGFKKNIAFQVYSAYARAEASKENMRISIETYNSSKEGRDLVLIKFKKSLSQLVDLIDTQSNLNQTRINAIVQENNYIDALIRLNYESGTIRSYLKIVE